jgi:single-strand DNA-binding protein
MSASTTLIGNITKQPEVHFANSGIAMCTFAVAVNKSKKNKDTGEWEKEAHFFDVVCFGNIAQNVADTFTTGNRIVVVGEPQQRRYQGQDGTEKVKIEFVAEEVAVSVNWATATITRNERPEGDNAGYRGNQYTSGSAPAPRVASAPKTEYEEMPF